ncbi:hypothetical protein ACFYOT_20350 [Saccharothrix saharensis]|uniref:hypothetical protein n=1 Tax=Saccharothrix saharensis TaxID=571190 RepID=UPI0036B830E9
MNLVERKLLELDGKIAGIEEEFRPWLADARDGGPLRKHRSQLTRIIDTLHGLTDRAAEERAAVEVAAEDALDRCRRVQDVILEVYRVWEFFRSKFALRYHETYQGFLAVADEFAWACYEPALEHADIAHRPKAIGTEPPLVYFSGDFSPYIHLRGEAFDVEEVEGADGTDEFDRVLLSLPVPVVAVPRYQLNHLPELPLLAHEVGHCVEQDFDLALTTSRHLSLRAQSMPQDRRSTWRGWLSELFADCFATVTAGPSYVSALVDFLAFGPDVASDAGLPPMGTSHPPARLRIAVATELLTHTGFEPEAQAIRSSWARDPIGPYAPDVGTVTEVLLSVEYPQLRDRTLLDLRRFTPEQHRHARTAAKAALNRQVPSTSDIRSLVAGSRIAFQDAPEQLSRSQAVILGRAQDTLDDKPRRTDERATSAADRAAGAALFDQIADRRNRTGDRS